MRIIGKFAIALISIAACACGAGRNSFAPLESEATSSPEAQSGKSPEAPSAAGVERAGGMSGGGGFQYNNSKAFLKAVTKELADEIESMNAVSFKNFPKGLGQKEMAQIIRGTRSDYETVKTRQNPDGEIEGLMFDFGRDEKGYYITALRPYFEAYQSLPYQQYQRERGSRYRSGGELIPMHTRDLKNRLLHEFAHHLGLGEKEAARFAVEFDNVMRRSFLLCTVLKPDPRPHAHGLILLERTSGRVLFYDNLHLQNEQAVKQQTEEFLKEGLDSQFCVACGRFYMGDSEELERVPSTTPDEIFYRLPNSNHDVSVAVDLNSLRGKFTGYVWNGDDFTIGGEISCEVRSDAVTIPAKTK